MIRIARDERGASLVLAIVFMLVVGTISAAGLSMLASGLHDRVSLDKVRNRQYAADAGIEKAIADARDDVEAWSAATNAATPQTRLQTFLSRAQCGTFPASTMNGVTIYVICKPAPALHAGYFQFNVAFKACTDSGCSATPIVRAEVNFDTSGAVTRTYVQSWSVNA